MNEIDVFELKKILDSATKHLLIDVREDFERKEFNIGGTWIPMNEIPQKIDQIPKTDCDVIIYCRSGKRSANVIQYLESFGYKNLYNLKGGVISWQNEF